MCSKLQPVNNWFKTIINLIVGNTAITDQHVFIFQWEMHVTHWHPRVTAIEDGGFFPWMKRVQVISLHWLNSCPLYTSSICGKSEHQAEVQCQGSSSWEHNCFPDRSKCSDGRNISKWHKSVHVGKSRRQPPYKCSSLRWNGSSSRWSWGEQRGAPEPVTSIPSTWGENTSLLLTISPAARHCTSAAQRGTACGTLWVSFFFLCHAQVWNTDTQTQTDRQTEPKIDPHVFLTPEA